MINSSIGCVTTRKVAEAVAAYRAYAPEIEAGVATHYPGRHIREWHRGDMSSRELLNMLAGMPFESWFRCSVREDMDELIGDATVQKLQEVREKTEALLNGDVKPRPGGIVNDADIDDDTDDETPVRRRRRANHS